MYYFISGLLIVGAVFVSRLYLHERAMGEANNVILDTLKENMGVVSATDIHRAVSQAGIDVSIDDIYHLLTLMCESKDVRCYRQPELNGDSIASHGTYAIDTISMYNS